MLKYAIEQSIYPHRVKVILINRDQIAPYFDYQLDHIFFLIF